MKNSLKYAKLLESAGLPRKQAEMHIRVISESLGEEMVTKSELKALDLKFESKLKALDLKIDKLEVRLMNEIQKLKNEIQIIKHDIKDMQLKLQGLEHRLTVKLGALMIAVPTIIKVFFN